MSIPALGVSNIILRLSNYRLQLLLLPLLISLSVGIKSALSPPVFTAFARLLPPQTNTATATALLNQVGGTAVLGASALTLKNPSDLYASLFFSRTVQDNIIERFQLGRHYDIDDIDDLRVEVGKRTKVDVGRDGIITLSYTDKGSNSAADITNAMIDAMYKIARHLARSEAERRIQFYDSLIAEAQQSLEKANAQLMESEQNTGLTRLQGQEEASAAAMVELRGMIATREVEIHKMLVTATHRHPEVIRVQSELGALRKQLAAIEQPADRGTPATAKRASGSGSIFLSFDKYAKMRASVEPLRKAVEIDGNVLEQLIKARALSRIDESRDFSVISVLDHAVAPTRKSGPRIFVNAAIGGVIGFLLTTILILAWDILFSDEARRQRWRTLIRSFMQLPELPAGLRRRRAKTAASPEPPSTGKP